MIHEKVIEVQFKKAGYIKKELIKGKSMKVIQIKPHTQSLNLAYKLIAMNILVL